MVKLAFQFNLEAYAVYIIYRSIRLAVCLHIEEEPRCKFDVCCQSAQPSVGMGEDVKHRDFYVS